MCFISFTKTYLQKHGEMFGSRLLKCGREAVQSKLFTLEKIKKNWEVSREQI